MLSDSLEVSVGTCRLLPQGSVKPPPVAFHIPDTVLPLTVWHVLRFAFEMRSACSRPLTVGSFDLSTCIGVLGGPILLGQAFDVLEDPPVNLVQDQVRP